nr:uncharacterized protein LOC129381265 [Dermacentor andersoni]
MSPWVFAAQAVSDDLGRCNPPSTSASAQAQECWNSLIPSPVAATKPATHQLTQLPEEDTRVTANASTSSLLLRSSTSIDHGRPSTSRAGTEQATAILEDGARFPETSSVGQWNTQYHMANGTSSVPGTLQPRDLSHSGELAPVLSGHTDNTEDGSTGFRLPVYSSSGGDDAVASAISAGIEEASGVLGNEARFFSHVAFDRKYL